MLEMDHFVHLIICQLWKKKQKQKKTKKERKEMLKLVLITYATLGESFILGNVIKFKEHII